GRCLLSKFADDTKLGGVVDTPERCAAIQKYLDRLERWAEKDCLKFNKVQCRVLHLGRCLLSKFADDTKLGGVVDTPERCAAIQKYLDRLERWAEKDCLKFNKVQCRVLHLVRNNSRHQYRLEVTCWKAVLWRRTWGILVNNKLPMSQQCPCGQEGRWYPGMHWEKHYQQVEGGDPAPLLSPGEASSGVLCPVLGSSVPESHGPPGPGLAKGYKVD
ncbi:hypothetical protein HGM15179_020631, partial [Zosterops borbonicus]